MRNILGIVNEWNSKENTMSVSRCQRENARQGFYNGAPTPFGYTTVQTDIPARSGFKKRLAIDAKEAEVVQLIFELASVGLNGQILVLKKIAEYLNDQGFQRCVPSALA